ncbi:unnamed protein product [Larinioides sclopetarius]|uniref:tRNA:m(4)X modification enzyme TRM13 n=1 Tax=Larinioides sclopetarius TaxID=280406 RepID=A0AAV2B9M0_9ARAC
MPIGSHSNSSRPSASRKHVNITLPALADVQAFFDCGDEECHHSMFMLLVSGSKICGLLMALCCHHRCSWNTYIGKQFMEKHDFTENDFKLMCCVASWATCGLRKTDKATENSEEHTTEIPDENLLNRYQRLNLKHEEREVIGMQCKRLIDAGRIQFLKDEGYDARLITYIDKSVSLENVALLATCKKS